MSPNRPSKAGMKGELMYACLKTRLWIAMTPPSLQKLVAFQAVNFVASVPIYAMAPFSVFGLSVIYQIFSIKVVALIYFNDFPLQKDKFSIVFFALACIETVLLFSSGAFSIYTFLFSRL